MRNAEEKRVYQLLDRLDREEAEGLIEKVSMNMPSEELLEEEALARVKSRTWEKLGIAQAADKTAAAEKAISGPPRRYWKKRLAAASVALFVLASAIASSSDVQADIKKALRFIPGFGYVKEEDRAHKTMVLTKPVVTKIGAGELKIDAVMVEEAGTMVQISGKLLAAPDHFVLETGEGKSYSLKRSMLASGGEWQGLYYYQGAISVTEATEITLRLPQTNIGPLHLAEPRTGDELQDLGRTAIVDGIKVAAIVTPLEGNRSKVNLLSQLPQGMKIDSYGIRPINKGIKLSLRNEAGAQTEIPEDSGFIKTAEFDFADVSAGSSRYSLTIPYLRVINTEAPFMQVKLPVPAAGASTDINVSVSLAGFPVHFYRIERETPKSVRIYTDVHYNTEAPQTLQDFRVDMKDPDRQSYRWKVNDDTRAMDFMDLEIRPDVKELTFYIGEPWILLKGPWNIDLGNLAVSE